MTRSDLNRVIANFRNVRIGVVGDMVADLYIEGEPERLSREAPVVIARYTGQRLVPGSAANTVNNLASLGAKVSAVGLVGRDDQGRHLKRALASARVNVSGLIELARIPTVTKTRVMIGDRHTRKQQVVRIDREPDQALTPAEEKRILRAFEAADRRVDAWVVSDYGYLVVSPRVVAALKRIARSKPVVVDSRYRAEEFPGVTCIKANEAEAEALAGVRITGDSDARAAGREILSGMRVNALLMTRGNEGMMLFEGRRAVTIPICGGTDIVDVTGAGDTVAAVFTLALVAGADMETAARIANFAAAVVVMKYGAATCSPEELTQKARDCDR